MLRDERLEKIKTYILKRESTSIHDLMKTFNISRATVRRDLNMLTLPEEFQLTRGGIIRQPTEKAFSELPYSEKRASNVQEKKRIAQAACNLIKPNTTIMIDNGSTTIEMAEVLKSAKNIHIVTDDILLASSLTMNPYIDVTVLGGRLRTGFFSVHGYYTESLLRQLHFDQSFMSIDAVDLNGGCTISNIDEVSVKKEILRCSTQTILLCDHTKFEMRSVAQVCRLEEISLFITGTELEEGKYNAMCQGGHNIILV